MSDLNLGHLIDAGTEADRDAIHVAVAPVVSSGTFRPGEHVGLNSKGMAAILGVELIGVVDPFLKYGVSPGDRFWLFLYPKTITNLRHHWTHPAFADEKPIEIRSEETEHVQWLREFAETADVTYSRLMSAANRWIENDDYLILDYSGYPQIPDEFWSHFEAVTGKKGRGSFFSCSC